MYTLFEVCTVQVNGVDSKRGARIACGHCGKQDETVTNTMKSSGHDDQEVVDRFVAHKFERLGWKVGNYAKQHRCPACYAAAKNAAKRKQKEQREKEMADSKIVNLAKTKEAPPPLASSTALQSTMKDKVSASGQQQPRAMNREEKYLIWKKLDEHYVGGKGYAHGWDDAKVATDLGVMVIYVAEICEEIFGPNVDEETSTVLAEARALLAEIKAVADTLIPAVNTLLDLRKRQVEMCEKVNALEKRK